MRSRLVSSLAFFILILTFVVDAFTPQTLVIAILLDVPIVLAALTQSRRLTAVLVVISLAADILAGSINAYREGYWSPIGLIDRGLTLLSILLVGVLGSTLQDRAKRVTRLAIREMRAQREATLASASERIRSTLSSELVVRAIVREAIVLLHADEVRWYPDGKGDSLAAHDPGGVALLSEPLPPEIASVARRALDEEEILFFAGTDPFARYLLDRLQARFAMAIPVHNRSQSFGVLLVSCDVLFDEEVVSIARAFAKLAETALVQARLFDELAQRNEELAQREEIIRDLVYALSHDLRTPLAALALTLRQARDGGYGQFPEEYREVLAASMGSINDLRRLAETLLLVARIEAGEHQSRPERVDVQALAQDVVAEFEAMAQSRSIQLHTEGSAVVAVADRADVRRAVVNLVANALHYSMIGGRVTLRCSHENQRVKLEIIDDGFGVEREQIPYLFKRFSGGRAGGGSGLGLYLVRRIAEQNGGAANYEAHQPRGSIFSIELPEANAAYD